MRRLLRSWYRTVRSSATGPPLGHGYIETFNKPNVNLIDIKSNAIPTEHGLQLKNGEEYEFDMIICALGFDAATGALATMTVRANEGVSLSEQN